MAFIAHEVAVDGEHENLLGARFVEHLVHGVGAIGRDGDDVHATLDLGLDDRDLRGRLGGRRGDEFELAADLGAGVLEAAGDRVEVGVAGVLADIDDLELIGGEGAARQGERGDRAEQRLQQAFGNHGLPPRYIAGFPGWTARYRSVRE